MVRQAHHDVFGVIAIPDIVLFGSITNILTHPMTIVTRTGDNGETGLYGNERTPKHSPRIEAIGSVDELNALLGVTLAQNTLPKHIHEQLTLLQHRLFRLGADLAAASDDAKVPRITEEQVHELEEWINTLEQGLPPLRTFILPGGARGGAALHHLRAVCRRAERRAIQLAQTEQVNLQARIFLNRLSDYLFLAARSVNWDEGAEETEVQY